MNITASPYAFSPYAFFQYAFLSRSILRQISYFTILVAVIATSFAESILAADNCASMLTKFQSSIDSNNNGLYPQRVIVTFKEPKASLSFIDRQRVRGLNRKTIDRLPKDKVTKIESLKSRDVHIIDLLPSQRLTLLDFTSAVGDSNCTDVSEIEPDQMFSISADPPELTIYNWGLQNVGQEDGMADADVDAPEAWPLLPIGSTVVVALLDTGVDYTHPDLASQIYVSPTEVINGLDDDNNGYIDDVSGMNMVTCTGSVFFGSCFSGAQNPHADPMDDHGHGTHVAGILAAASNGRGIVGVAPNVKILPVKILNASGGGLLSDIYRSLDYVLDMRLAGHNIRVISNSWGSLISCSSTMTSYVNSINDAGTLFLAAAGNDSKDMNTVNIVPAECGKAVAVASIDESGNLSSFSNYGAPAVEIAAPGTRIYSTFLRTVIPFYSYATYSGTSMATPMAAGVAAIAFIKKPTLTPEEVATLLESTSKPLPDLQNKVRSGGVVSAYNILNAIN